MHDPVRMEAQGIQCHEEVCASCAWAVLPMTVGGIMKTAYSCLVNGAALCS